MEQTEQLHTIFNQLNFGKMKVSTAQFILNTVGVPPKISGDSKEVILHICLSTLLNFSVSCEHNAKVDSYVCAIQREFRQDKELLIFGLQLTS